MGNNVAYWIQIITIVILGVIGNLILKYKVNMLGIINFERLRELSFLMKFFSSPLIIISLSLLFISRMLWILPLSYSGLGRFNILMSPMYMILILIGSNLIFGEQFSLKAIIGIIFGIIAILLIGSEV